jgi:ribosomal protein S8
MDVLQAVTNLLNPVINKETLIQLLDDSGYIEDADVIAEVSNVSFNPTNMKFTVDFKYNCFNTGEVEEGCVYGCQDSESLQAKVDF